jgi:transcriptional regulator with XRE-family HTH domain
MKLSKISTTVRYERLRRGMTQQVLSELSGVSKGRIETIENGRCSDIGIKTLSAILEPLNLEVKIQKKRKS